MRPEDKRRRRLALGATAAGAVLLLSSCADAPNVAGPGKSAYLPPGLQLGPNTKVPGLPKIGGPYQIAGVWYYPQEDPNYDQLGLASWYGEPFHGRSTANGEIYDQNELTAAHQTLPMPSFVRVTNLENGRSIV